MSDDLSPDLSDQVIEHAWEMEAQADREARRADNAEMERDRLLATLRLIAAADPVDLALDPTWSQRIARERLPEYQTTEDV